MAWVGQGGVRALTQVLCRIDRLLIVSIGLGHVILAASPNATRIDSRYTTLSTIIATAIVLGEHFVEEVRVIEVDQVGVS